MAHGEDDQPPFESGSQPVADHPPDMPNAGWTAGQVIVIALAILVLLAGIGWFAIFAR